MYVVTVTCKSSGKQEIVFLMKVVWPGIASTYSVIGNPTEILGLKIWQKTSLALAFILFLDDIHIGISNLNKGADSFLI